MVYIAGTPGAWASAHAITCQWLSIDRQPDMAVVGEASDGKNVLERTRALKPDIV